MEGAQYKSLREIINVVASRQTNGPLNTAKEMFSISGKSWKDYGEIKKSDGEIELFRVK